MTGDKEILSYLNENINMGIEALESLMKMLESTDNKIRSNVAKSLDAYKCFYKECEELLRDIDVKPKKSNLMAVLMSKMGTKTEFMKDNSDSKIAETLIQGYNMGIIDITKKLKKYKNDVSKDVQKLCESYKDMMNKGIKDIKGFL